MPIREMPEPGDHSGEYQLLKLQLMSQKHEQMKLVAQTGQVQSKFQRVQV
ncbi:hypothetical protein [Acinetobacter radioresistens]|nr:hypothetical protein [Acinetobacter radioresistens]